MQLFEAVAFKQSIIYKLIFILLKTCFIYNAVTTSNLHNVAKISSTEYMKRFVSMFPKKNEDGIPLALSFFATMSTFCCEGVEMKEMKDMKGKPKIEWIKKKLRKGN